MKWCSVVLQRGQVEKVAAGVEGGGGDGEEPFEEYGFKYPRRGDPVRCSASNVTILGEAGAELGEAKGEVEHRVRSELKHPGEGKGE